jgi:hypothetical protein
MLLVPADLFCHGPAGVHGSGIWGTGLVVTRFAVIRRAGAGGGHLVTLRNGEPEPKQAQGARGRHGAGSRRTIRGPAGAGEPESASQEKTTGPWPPAGTHPQPMEATKTSVTIESLAPIGVFI